MSTAGKVLSVLTVLLALVWVVLTSAIADFNKAGTRAVDKAQKDLIAARKSFTTLVVDVQTAKDATDKQQVQTQDVLTTLQGRQSDKEKERSQSLQLVSRFKLQAEGAEAGLKAAQNLDDERLQEKEAETKAREDAKALVAKLMGENDEYLNRLSDLRDQLAKTLQANKAMADRLNKARDSVPVPTTSRPAALAPSIPVSLAR